MSASESVPYDLDELAADFLDRLQRGERPAPAEYTRRHPEHALEILDLFQTILAMEGYKEEVSQDVEIRAQRQHPVTRTLGHYELYRELGRGGMGVVYEAEDTLLHRQVAVKVLQRQLTSDPELRERFRREARTVARLQHPNIVPVFDVGEEQDFQYFVMPLVQGIGVSQLLEELVHHSRQDDTFPDWSHLVGGLLHRRYQQSEEYSETGPMPAERTSSWVSTFSAPRLDSGRRDSSTPPDAPTTEKTPVTPDARHWQLVARIGVQVASALKYAHAQGIVHRDIKPGNLLLDERLTVWVTDFGLAKAMEGDNLTNSQDVLGTLRYMAPERFRGISEPRGDIYSLGVTLFELAGLRPVFEELSPTELFARITQSQPASLHQLIPSIPRDLSTIIRKAMDPEPGHRYQSAEELRHDLELFLEGRPIQARQIGPGERLVRWSRRNPVVASLIALSALLMLTTTITAVVGYVQIDKALTRETNQREQTEAALSLSGEVLDKLFRRYVPQMAGDFASGDGQTVSSSAPQLSVTPEQAKFMRDMLTYYGELSRLKADDAKMQRESARATRRVGDIYERLGDDAAAEEEYRKSLQQYAAMRDGDVGLEQAGIWIQLGRLHCRNQQAVKMQEAYTEAEQLLASRTDPRALHALALANFQRGQLILRNSPPMGRPDGRPPEPGQGEPLSGDELIPREQRLEYLREAIRLTEAWGTQEPENPDCRYLQAICYRELADDPRSEELQQSIKLLQELCEQYPQRPAYRSALVMSYGQVNPRAVAPNDQELSELVITHLRKAVAESETLTRRYSDEFEYIHYEVHLRHKLGTFLMRRRGPLNKDREITEEARQVLVPALELQHRVMERVPQEPSHKLWLVAIYQSLADCCHRRQEYATALKYQDEGLKTLEPLQLTGELAEQAESMRVSLEERYYETLGQHARGPNGPSDDRPGPPPGRQPPPPMR